MLIMRQKTIDFETGCDSRARQMIIDYDADGVNTISYTFAPKIPLETALKMRPAIMQVRRPKTKTKNKGKTIRV